MAYQHGLTVSDLHTCVTNAVDQEEDHHFYIPWLASMHEGPREDALWLRKLEPLG